MVKDALRLNLMVKMSYYKLGGRMKSCDVVEIYFMLPLLRTMLLEIFWQSYMEEI